MMENPNVNVRRRTSLPGTGQSSILLKMSHKSNPYIGTFRHSPPTKTVPRPPSCCWNGHSMHQLLNLKNSARFHRSPLSLTLPEEFCRILFYEASSGIPREVNGLRQLRDLLCGHLVGGAGDDLINWPQFQRTLQKQSHSSSGTVQVLSRLAYLLFRPFQPDMPKKPYYDDRNDENSFQTDSPYDTEDDDDDASSLHSIQNSSPYGSSSVISSQAEAYYAHQATTLAKDILFAEDRLDFTITQQDVIRMNRNASRHLDVDSIVQLPVITYKSESVSTKREEDNHGEDPDMSWLLVPNERQEGGTDESPASPDKDEDVCVICLEHFRPGDRLRVLPCEHLFHVGCVDRWLSGSHSFDDCVTHGCPTCKKRADANLIADAEHATTALDGSVPSWAFSRVGEALANSHL